MHKISLKVFPNSSKESLEIDEKNSMIKIRIKEKAEKGRANLSIEKLFSKKGITIKIVRGKTSRNKIILSSHSLEEIKKKFQKE